MHLIVCSRLRRLVLEEKNQKHCIWIQVFRMDFCREKPLREHLQRLSCFLHFTSLNPLREPARKFPLYRVIQRECVLWLNHTADQRWGATRKPALRLHATVHLPTPPSSGSEWFFLNYPAQWWVECAGLKHLKGPQVPSVSERTTGMTHRGHSQSHTQLICIQKETLLNLSPHSVIIFFIPYLFCVFTAEVLRFISNRCFTMFLSIWKSLFCIVIVQEYSSLLQRYMLPPVTGNTALSLCILILKWILMILI